MNDTIKHQSQDENVRWIVTLGIGALALVVVVGLFAYGWQQFLAYAEQPNEQVLTQLADLRRPPSSPSPLDDLPSIERRLQTEQTRRLKQTGWVDRDKGIARIDIDAAMRDIEQNGWPKFGTDQ